MQNIVYLYIRQAPHRHQHIHPDHRQYNTFRKMILSMNSFFTIMVSLYYLSTLSTSHAMATSVPCEGNGNLCPTESDRQVSPIQCSPIIPPLDCSHQLNNDLQSSSWGEFLESGILVPAQDNTDHHIKRLKHTLAELAAIIDHHKDDYTQDIFGEPYNKTDKELEDLAYPILISENSSIPVLSQSSLLAYYSLFQHLAISIEVVTIDHHHHHYTNKMWRKVSHTVDIILKNIFTELVMKGIPIPTPLTRNIIPNTMRCLPSFANRDIRDFLILRHLQQTALSYSARLEEARGGIEVLE